MAWVEGQHTAPLRSTPVDRTQTRHHHARKRVSWVIGTNPKLRETTMSQDTKPTITDVVESALAVDQVEASVLAQSSGYESMYVNFVAQYLAVRNEGTEQKVIVEAIKAEADRAGTTPHVGSKSSINIVDALANFYALPGDMPTVAGIAWVYRPDAKSAVGLAEGEASVHSLIKRISDPGERREVLKAEGIRYGKPVADAAIRASKNKADALSALQALLRSFDAAVKEHKAKAKGPVQAEKYLKAATGPLSKVIECLDGGEFGDADEVRSLATAILSEVNAILSHAKLAV